MKKIRFKKRYLHPVTTLFLLTLLVVFISWILSLFNFQTTYNVIDVDGEKVEQVTTAVYNLLSFDGLKYIVSNAAKNFVSFAPLSTYILAIIGIAVCEASGFLDMIFKKIFENSSNAMLTFIIVFLGTISSLINEVGFVLLIPLAAILFKAKKRNPLAGVCAAFASTAFGLGTSIFVGSTDVTLIPYTKAAARLIDSTFHVSLTSNLFIMIGTSIILSIIGTIIIEKLIIPRLGRYREKQDLTQSMEIEIIDQEELLLSNNYKEKRGFKWAFSVGIIFLIIFAYSLIPNLPFSGLLLDMNESTYLAQLFGNNSYFQDGFTFMISLLLILMGIFYGLGSKQFTSDKDLIDKTINSLSHVSYMIGILFMASQFVAIFKKSNIGTVIAGILSNMLSSFNFSGIPFLIISVIIIMISNFFLTSAEAKWVIFAPIIVPTLLQSNIHPAFTQFAFRAADSMTNGISPFYAYFIIFVGYLNIYNNRKQNRAITIGDAVRLLTPYFVIISISWLLIIIGWYIIGLPIGPSVFPTI